jgi:hypothetical protein
MERLRRPLLQMAAAKLYRRSRLRDWPRWAGDALEVSVPKTIRRKASVSTEGSSNINIITYLLDQTRGIAGNVAECGVYRGASLCAIAFYLLENDLNKHVFGLDSFQGFDESIERDLQLGGIADSQKRVGGFDATSLEYVARKVSRLDLAKAITLMRGYFADTLRRLPEQNWSFVHLDCDIYESYKVTLEYFYPRMSDGGVILFDEYEDPPWPGCKMAVDEFLAGKAEVPTAIEADKYIKYYIEVRPRRVPIEIVRLPPC